MMKVTFILLRISNLLCQQKTKSFKVLPQYDEQQEVYYIVTGCMTFTKIGLELYKSLKKADS